MLKQGSKQNAIAKAIGKDPSVISREIRRNRDKRSGEYRSTLAQTKYCERLKTKNKQVKFTSEVQKYVEAKLSLQWSPEQISNKGSQQGLKMVSHERIYQHIIADKKRGGELFKELRRKKKYRNRLESKDNRGKIKDMTNISERPAIVDEKSRVGDFEVDLVIGANHKSALVTLNDRCTGFALVKKVKSKNATQVAKAIVKLLTPYNRICKTITSDNGKEFAEHKYVSKQLGIDFYFADPYSSWQRGANENYNGLLRQYFPKKSDFSDLTWQAIKKTQKRLNNRPRKRLGFKTPLEVINSLTKIAFVD